MNKVLGQIISLQSDDKIIEMIYKSDIDLQDSLEDIIELLGSYAYTKKLSIEKQGIKVDDMITCLGCFDIDNADTLIINCKMLHKYKREICRLIENGASDQELKTLGRLCVIVDKNCYQTLKQKYGIVRTVSKTNDETDFCKY
ncbi:MAG: hypothetical protein MR412_03570 [Firmicutes bacterium]|nr:hypothetical protein [Bacillota bacterium]MDY5676324.1 hypothetical protein [Eubacteriales bacterium]